MKKLLWVIALMVFTATQVQAQSSTGKVRAAKIEYLASRIHLSQEQAAKFWPLFNEYEDHFKELRKEIKEKYKVRGGNVNDKVATVKYIYSNPEFKAKRQVIRLKYRARFLQILSDAQYKELYRALDDFREKLIQQLEQGKDVEVH